MAKYREFRRPAIDLDAKTRSWAQRYPANLATGDVIPEHGEVEWVKLSQTGEGEVHIRFVSGDTQYFDHSKVYCFSRGD